MEKWIAGEIYRQIGATSYHTKNTHSNKLSGKWSTPDFTTVCCHKFSYASSSAVEIVSFEVKDASTQFDVAAVYEALAHTRVSTYSVLMVYVDPRSNIEKMGLLSVYDEIKSTCASVGVGLIITSYPTVPEQWHYVVMARRNSPDLRKVDEFIEEAFKTNVDKEWLKKNL